MNFSLSVDRLFLKIMNPNWTLHDVARSPLPESTLFLVCYHHLGFDIQQMKVSEMNSSIDFLLD